MEATEKALEAKLKIRPRGEAPHEEVVLEIDGREVALPNVTKLTLSKDWSEDWTRWYATIEMLLFAQGVDSEIGIDLKDVVLKIRDAKFRLTPVREDDTDDD